MSTETIEQPKITEARKPIMFTAEVEWKVHPMTGVIFPVAKGMNIRQLLELVLHRKCKITVEEIK